MLKLGDLVANIGEKKQGFVNVYDTDYSMPVTLINGEGLGKTILITGGIHGCEYTAIQTVMELAKEINPKDVKGKIIIIHPVNIQAFKKKVSAVVVEDNKNLNREFPGNINGTITEKISYFIENECHSQCDFYVDLHGGDLYEMATNFVYYPGIAEESVINKSKEIASLLNVDYMVKSGAKTGSYNYAAIKGVPSILIEKGATKQLLKI
ncbi:MAG: M14 family metallopeptidase [Clostridium perfringens]|nr:M14 family metallopeptidase [Clostridium perfringens]